MLFTGVFMNIYFGFLTHVLAPDKKESEGSDFVEMLTLDEHYLLLFEQSCFGMNELQRLCYAQHVPRPGVLTNSFLHS
jgi:hypothetical protein